MKAREARGFLRTTIRTELGKQVVQDLGYAPIAADPEKADDWKVLVIAYQVKNELKKRDPDVS